MALLYIIGITIAMNVVPVCSTVHFPISTPHSPVLYCSMTAIYHEITLYLLCWRTRDRLLLPGATRLARATGRPRSLQLSDRFSFWRIFQVLLKFRDERHNGIRGLVSC